MHRPWWHGSLSQQIKYSRLIKRYIACFKHKTIRCYSIAIGIQQFITLVFNSTIRIDFRIWDRSDPRAGD